MTELSKGIATFSLQGEAGGSKRLRKVGMSINRKPHSRKSKSLTYFYGKGKGKSNPITCLDRPGGFQEFKAPRFQDIRLMKVVSLSALRTVHLYPTENIPGTHFC